MEAEVKRQLTEKEREHLIEIQRIRKENKKEIDVRAFFILAFVL